MPPMFKMKKKKSGVLGTRKLKSMHISLRLARFICIFGQQNCIMHENSQDTLTTAGNILQWRPLEIGIAKQALECMYRIVKEIEIIHRLFLVITMYCQASSMNHSTCHIASWLERKPRYKQ